MEEVVGNEEGYYRSKRKQPCKNCKNNFHLSILKETYKIERKKCETDYGKTIVPPQITFK